MPLRRLMHILCTGLASSNVSKINQKHIRIICLVIYIEWQSINDVASRRRTWLLLRFVMVSSADSTLMLCAPLFLSFWCSFFRNIIHPRHFTTNATSGNKLIAGLNHGTAKGILIKSQSANVTSLTREKRKTRFSNPKRISTIPCTTRSLIFIHVANSLHKMNDFYLENCVYVLCILSFFFPLKNCLCHAECEMNRKLHLQFVCGDSHLDVERFLMTLPSK